MAVQTRELRSSARSTNVPAHPVVVLPSVSLHKFVYVITAILALLVVTAVLGNAITWVREKYDDVRYGTPRTFHAEQVIGIDDAEGTPSHFIAMNLNRQVVIVQIPGGDTSKMRTITGPYLFGAGEDKTPVLLHFEDVNGDGTRDMIVDVKNEALVFLNRDGELQQLQPEDRAQIALEK